MKVAVLGYGVVGYGVYDMICHNPLLTPSKVLVRPEKKEYDFQVTDIDEIINDESIDCVVECTNGIDEPYQYAIKVLKSGKHFISSNKALVVSKGIQLTKLAYENNCSFLLSASCGGAIPFLHNLSVASISDQIVSVSGILNGTTNFMLDLMQSENINYNDALQLAQKLGYAEKDPSADVSGLDALRKIILALAVSFNKLVDSGMEYEGIESFTLQDIDILKKDNKEVRLIASGNSNDDGSVSCYVIPTIFPKVSIEASVKKNFNMAHYKGVNCGDITLIGQGAGRYPTASAVLRDISECLDKTSIMLKKDLVACSCDNSQKPAMFFIRCNKKDSEYFPIEKIYKQENELMWLQTDKIKVSEMFEIARRIRKDGKDIFFALVEE